MRYYYFVSYFGVLKSGGGDFGHAQMILEKPITTVDAILFTEAEILRTSPLLVKATVLNYILMRKEKAEK